ncbi:MAG: hypothetical protein GVY36_16990 [Verrucomicrobia bacterium]|jgi:hypothetical protein|nr:hypothetical protein [Verrucomicrobiota bacterium]
MNTTKTQSAINETQNKENTMINKDKSSTTKQTQTKGNKMKKTKIPKTIREVAIAKGTKGEIKPETIQTSVTQYNARLAASSMRMMSPQELATLKVADEYQREEKKNHIVRLTKVLLEGGEFLPPIVVAVRKNEDGTSDRYIVDGQQRRRALVEANLPQYVIEVPFDSLGEEKTHFLGIQRGMTVNTSHIIAVSDGKVAKEIRRLAKLEGHPAKDRIFLGKERRLKTQIPAKSVENLVNRFELPLDKLDRCLRVLFGAFEERNIDASAVTSAMLRGFVGFYKAFEKELDPNDEAQMTSLYGILTAAQKFPRKGDNSTAGGKSCQTILTNEFKRCKAA